MRNQAMDALVELIADMKQHVLPRTMGLRTRRQSSSSDTPSSTSTSSRPRTRPVPRPQEALRISANRSTCRGAASSRYGRCDGAPDE